MDAQRSYRLSASYEFGKLTVLLIAGALLALIAVGLSEWELALWALAGMAACAAVPLLARLRRPPLISAGARIECGPSPHLWLSRRYVLTPETVARVFPSERLFRFDLRDGETLLLNLEHLNEADRQALHQVIRQHYLAQLAQDVPARRPRRPLAGAVESAVG